MKLHCEADFKRCCKLESIAIILVIFGKLKTMKGMKVRQLNISWTNASKLEERKPLQIAKKTFSLISSNSLS